MQCPKCKSPLPVGAAGALPAKCPACGAETNGAAVAVATATPPAIGTPPTIVPHASAPVAAASPKPARRRGVLVPMLLSLLIVGLITTAVLSTIVAVRSADEREGKARLRCKLRPR